MQTEIVVVYGKGDRYLASIDVGGGWWSGPTEPDGPTTTDLRLGRHDAAVTRTGDRLVMTSLGESFELDHTGRCID